jgi:hypothetical protein
MQKIEMSTVSDIREGNPQDTFDIGVKDWHNFVLANNLLSANCIHTIARRGGKMDISLGLHRTHARCLSPEKARNSVYGLEISHGSTNEPC